jgi:N-formylglutamate amidohydrolase
VIAPLPRAAFLRLGPQVPLSPVVLSVPHAGRDYPPALLERALPSRTALESLEDRYADLLIEAAVAEGAVAIVAQTARAWIDLNRDPRELDPAMLASQPSPQELLPSARVRNGLGLIPRRLGGGANILSGRIPLEEARRRISDVHTPYHGAIAQALDAARSLFGIAFLIDCHSMPPLPSSDGEAPAEVVIGDLNGHSASRLISMQALETACAANIRTAHNVPYAGAYTLRRHGQPSRNVHAIQIEIDRSLYLASDQRTPSATLPDMVELIRAIAAGLAGDTQARALPAAAE